MTFNKILETVTDEQRNSMADQVLKRREYNRKYQAKLRSKMKLANLHKKIDNNIDDVIAYIHTNYADKYAAWQPKKPHEVIDRAFTNWVLLSASDYPSIEQAFELSGLGDHINFNDFSRWFSKNYYENNSGGYTKY